MKKILILSLFLCFSFQFTSCKTEEKKNTETSLKKAATFSLKNAKNTVQWTAYKTTEKLPVKGVFKKVDILSNGDGNTVKEAIHNTEFSIPVSSIFSKDTSRDFKLKKFFFGVMENTKLLSGRLLIESDSTGTAIIKMNGVTTDLSFTYKITGNQFNLNGTMILGNWNAQNAIDSLNVASKELHKAKDGVSKTWNDVEINISTVFN